MNNNLNLTVTKSKETTVVRVENIPTQELRSVLASVLAKSMRLHSKKTREYVDLNEKPASAPSLPSELSLDLEVEMESGEYDKYLATQSMEEYSDTLAKYSNTKGKESTDRRSNGSLVACNCIGCGVTIVKRLPDEGDQVIHCIKCGEDNKITSTIKGKIKCHECGFESRLSRVQTLDNDDIDLKCCKCKTKLVGKYHEVNHIYTEARY